jgi:putative membrane protein insertion efficiency factor
MPARLAWSGLSARALLAAVRGYQLLLSPLFAGSCRYIPSCSQYMAEAVGRHGAVRGGWLGIRRLARCHPLGASGFDPVPAACPPDRAPHHASNHSRLGITPGVISYPAVHGNHSGSDFSHGKVC